MQRNGVSHLAEQFCAWTPYCVIVLAQWVWGNTATRHPGWEKSFPPIFYADCGQSPLLCNKMREKPRKSRCASKRRIKSCLVLPGDPLSPWIMEKDGETNKNVSSQAPSQLLCPSTRKDHIIFTTSLAPPDGLQLDEQSNTVLEKGFIVRNL